MGEIGLFETPVQQLRLIRLVAAVGHGGVKLHVAHTPIPAFRHDLASHSLGRNPHNLVKTERFLRAFAAGGKCALFPARLPVGIRIAQSDGQILRGIRRKEPRRQVIPAARRHRHTAHAGAEDGECRRSAKDDERCKSIHCPPSRPRLLRRPASRSCRAGGSAGSGAPPDRRALPA